jgi:hypothetical protein
MTKFLSRRPSGAMLVAIVALFVALGGAAYAATSINGKNIQNGTIAGSKLKKDTLTGTQINESKLGKVPRAKKADSATTAATATDATNATNATTATMATTATNANQLGGITASSYPHGVHIVTNTAGNTGNLPITVAAACPSGEVALGGGGNNTAPTGSVTFDREQLDVTSYTVTEFELVPGTPASWTASAEVACAAAG